MNMMIESYPPHLFLLCYPEMNGPGGMKSSTAWRKEQEGENIEEEKKKDQKGLAWPVEKEKKKKEEKKREKLKSFGMKMEQN